MQKTTLMETNLTREECEDRNAKHFAFRQPHTKQTTAKCPTCTRFCIDARAVQNATRRAALLALHQLGRIAVDDLPSLVPIESIHEPDVAARAFYAEQLDRLVAARELGATRLRR